MAQALVEANFCNKEQAEEFSRCGHIGLWRYPEPGTIGVWLLRAREEGVQQERKRCVQHARAAAGNHYEQEAMAESWDMPESAKYHGPIAKELDKLAERIESGDPAPEWEDS